MIFENSTPNNNNSVRHLTQYNYMTIRIFHISHHLNGQTDNLALSKFKTLAYIIYVYLEKNYQP